MIEKTVRDRIVSRLKELGLLTHEALVYVTLLSHPDVTASTLCKETSIPDSKIYYALEGLSKKGMILVQQSNPSVYNAMAPQEAIANLKHQLTDSLNEKIREADTLTELLSPIHESAHKPEELEIAYIIRGQKNIINRMKSLIQSSKQEITIFVHFPEVLREVRAALIEAQEKRGVKLNIAVTPEIMKSEDLSDLGEVKLLCCVLGVLISDMKTLLTLTNWTDEVAVLTQDQNLLRVCRDYYDNPVCCTEIKKRR